MNNYNLITILGPTACGKTHLATQLAYQLKSPIISADSRQVYRGMDIGTGKDLSEFIVDNFSIPYYLIDIANAGEKYNLFEYQRDFVKVFQSLSGNTIPILCGGTGLYIEAVLKNYQLQETPINKELRKDLETMTDQQLVEKLVSLKKLHNTSDSDTRKRLVRAIEIEMYQQQHPHIEWNTPIINSLIVGVEIDRDFRRELITKRLHQRLEDGMVDEVRQLLESGIEADDLIYYGLEYKFITQFLTGQISYDYMCEHLNIAIHQFAKRQMTWFRKMERDGFEINWLRWGMSLEEKLDKIRYLLTK